MGVFLKGVKLPHRKNTDGIQPLVMPAPDSVIIPTLMHIGAPAVPTVKKGDSVKVGTLIADTENGLCAPIHSSVSGTVKDIGELLMPDGNTVPAISIESNGLNEIDSNIAIPIINDKTDLVKAIKSSGVVGLGGAGFPTYAKLSLDRKISCLVINGAECEPYITSDSVTMTAFAENILFATETLMKYFDIDSSVIGIEKNKPAAIKKMQEITADKDNINVKILPSVYPQGGEKVLIYHTTGKIVPEGKLPIDVGCVVLNSTTTAFIGEFLKTGIPLTQKCITVDGGAISEPKNIIAPIGTQISDLIEFAGGFKEKPCKVLYGGPMMGITVPDLSYPVIKNTNAILAFNETECVVPKTTACIRCGACINACPFGINPPAIAKGLKNEDFDEIKKAGASLCMECGCCSYVCPASRPLVANNRLAKQALRKHAERQAK